MHQAISTFEVDCSQSHMVFSFALYANLNKKTFTSYCFVFCGLWEVHTDPLALIVLNMILLYFCFFIPENAIQRVKTFPSCILDHCRLNGCLSVSISSDHLLRCSPQIISSDVLLRSSPQIFSSDVLRSPQMFSVRETAPLWGLKWNNRLLLLLVF